MKLFMAFLLSTIAASADGLPIAIYNAADLKPEVIHSAEDALSRIFRLAGISIQTRVGDPSEEEAHLVVYTARPDVCGARRDIAIRILSSAPPGAPTAIVGLARPLAPRGVNVDVFADRVNAAALRHGRPVATVLAHAIAHEIGHVLLRSGQHSRNGLMSSHWNDQEYRLMPAGALIFSTEEGRQMVRGLTRHGCPQRSVAR